MGEFVELADAIQGAIKFLQLVEQELLLFAAFWFLVGAIDDISVDLCWLWLKLTAGHAPGAFPKSRAALRSRAALPS